MKNSTLAVGTFSDGCVRMSILITTDVMGLYGQRNRMTCSCAGRGCQNREKEGTSSLTQQASRLFEVETEYKIMKCFYQY